MEQRIPTFIINLEKRRDRKQHVLNEFSNKAEFDVTIVKAIEHVKGAHGLWLTISHIACNLIDPESEFTLLVEDDHIFTEFYDIDLLFESIDRAQQLKAEILLGGVSWFHTAVPSTKNLFWIDSFNATQFVILFKPFYKKLINNLNTYSGTADDNLSKIADIKFVIHPFISTQKEFGYSDASSSNDQEGYVTGIFSHSKSRLRNINRVMDHYRHHDK